MISTGIEPATFRFVTQHLNHCATAVPVTICVQFLILLNLYLQNSDCKFNYNYPLWQFNPYLFVTECEIILSFSREAECITCRVKLLSIIQFNIIDENKGKRCPYKCCLNYYTLFCLIQSNFAKLKHRKPHKIIF